MSANAQRSSAARRGLTSRQQLKQLVALCMHDNNPYHTCRKVVVPVDASARVDITFPALRYQLVSDSDKLRIRV